MACLFSIYPSAKINNSCQISEEVTFFSKQSETSVWRIFYEPNEIAVAHKL